MTDNTRAVLWALCHPIQALAAFLCVLMCLTGAITYEELVAIGEHWDESEKRSEP